MMKWLKMEVYGDGLVTAVCSTEVSTFPSFNQSADFMRSTTFSDSNFPHAAIKVLPTCIMGLNDT